MDIRGLLVRTLLFGLVSTLLSSCSLLTDSCTRLQKQIRSSEAIGSGIYFREFEIARNRFLEKSTFPSRLSEATVALLENYVEVQELLLGNPECLVDEELESVLRDGLPRIKKRIERAQISNDQAFLEMNGPLIEAYQSMELWVKK